MNKTREALAIEALVLAGHVSRRKADEAIALFARDDGAPLPALLRVGEQLSNIAFNWSQVADHKISDREREMLRKLAADWDNARRALEHP